MCISLPAHPTRHSLVREVETSDVAPEISVHDIQIALDICDRINAILFIVTP